MTNQNQDEAVEMLLRKPKVLSKTGLANSTLYYLMSKGDFPLPVKIGERSVAWKKTEIEEWINTRECSFIGRSYDKSRSFEIELENMESTNETLKNFNTKDKK